MKLCYDDETGTDGKSPTVVMVGLIADAARIHRTRSEFRAIYERWEGLPDGTIRELKSTQLYRGKGTGMGSMDNSGTRRSATSAIGSAKGNMTSHWLRANLEAKSSTTTGSPLPRHLLTESLSAAVPG